MHKRAPTPWWKRHALVLTICCLLWVGCMVIVGLGVVRLVQLPSTTTYALGDDIPIYPGAVLNDDFSTRLSGAFVSRISPGRVQMFDLPGESSLEELRTWYAQAMADGGWDVYTPTTQQPTTNVIGIWTKGSSQTQFVQIQIHPALSTDQRSQMIISAVRSRSRDS